MNVLLIISKNDKYGAQRLFLDNAAALIRLGHQVTIATRGSKGHVTDRAAALGIECHGLPLKGLSDLVALRRIVRKHRIDIIHSYLDRADYFALLTSWTTGVPAVTTMNVRRTHIGHRLAKRVAVVSLKQRDLLLAKGVPDQRISLIRPGIETERFLHPDPRRSDHWPKELKADDASVVFCHISSMLPQKNHAVSIALAAAFQKRGERPLLIIAGDPLSGDYYESLQRTIAASGLEGRVRFIGWTSELPELLSLSHFTLLPSVHEAFGIVLLEGMTAGTPVVATAGEGGAEVIEEHGTGFLYDRNEDVDALAGRMHALWQDRKAYEKLSARCRTVAQSEFSLASFGKRLLQFYENARRN